MERMTTPHSAEGTVCMYELGLLPSGHPDSPKSNTWVADVSRRNRPSQNSCTQGDWVWRVGGIGIHLQEGQAVLWSNQAGFPKFPGISGPWDVWEPVLKWWILVLSLSLTRQMQRLEKPSPVIKTLLPNTCLAAWGTFLRVPPTVCTRKVSWGGLWGKDGPSLLIDRQVWTLVSKDYT